MRSLDKARRLKERIYAGEPVLGTQLSLQDSSTMEIYGRAGFDWASVDTEHTAQTLVTVQSMIQAAYGWDIVPFVRPIILDHDEIRRFLDLGACGLLCPFIETAEQAKRLVDACRYSPRGKRGWNPLRASTFHIDDEAYMENFEDSLTILIIIESQIGADNAHEIMAVDGIDGVTVGGMDLSLDLGVFRQWDAPVYKEAVAKIRAGAQAAGKAFGTGAYDMETARRSIENKETLLLSLGDVNVLAQGVMKLAADLRAGIASTQ
jgi:2-keto-3-deoxy-L-rhamnonate aldolase RhmA